MSDAIKVTSYQKPQPGSFQFTKENLQKADAYKARYPKGREASAVIWVLYLAQKQNDGWLSKEALDYVAMYMEMAPIRVYEVASFYSMLNMAPVGKHLIQVCRTTSCWVRGSDTISAACMEAAGTSKLGETSEDGLFTVVEVECLGACANAPMFQLNDHAYFEDLSAKSAREIISQLRRGKTPQAGSQTGRQGSKASESSPELMEELLVEDSMLQGSKR